MEKKTFELFAGLVLIIILTCLISIYALGYFDSDGDGIIDNQDDFPNDPLKSKDSDRDGVSDNQDAFPHDPNEQYDRDLDGVGDNEDEFPMNPRESKDSDSDGVGDNADAFPNDSAASLDSDNDGYPNQWNEGMNQSDSITNLTLDAFPDNPNENTDTDGDGVGDNNDKFPKDHAASIDSDNDGYPNRWNEGMNQSDSITNLSLDAFPNDPNEHYDSDKDGTGDNADYYPKNPNSWRDPSTLPTEIVFDRYVNLSKISVVKGITYDGTFFYILNYKYGEDNTKKVYQFDSNFSYTGLSWDYTYYIENPTGIAYCNNHIYLIGTKYSGLYGTQSYIFKFTKTGEFNDSIDISSNISYAGALTSSSNLLYICDTERTSIHIYNASTLSHMGFVNISHFPSDIIVNETGNWSYINDQSTNVTILYLYDLDGNYKDWSKEFNQKRIELVGDFLIGISGNRLFIYKLF